MKMDGKIKNKKLSAVPIWNKEQIKKVKAWLKSPDGIATLKELGKEESEIDKWQRNYEYAKWWSEIKDVPFM